MLDGFENAAALLPGPLRDRAYGLSAATRERVEELRLRMGRRPTLLLPEGERPFAQTPVTEREISAVLDCATRSSLHSYGDSLRRGFITARGGVRLGVCGTAVMGEGMHSLREFSSLSIRIPRQVKSAGREVMDGLSQGEKSVLILSPPGGGKTTFLRELVRATSDRGVRVALADERQEVAAVWQGCPQFDVGLCTDVLSGAPKAEGALLLLRAMNPQVLALDEVTAPADVAAIESVANCGVKIYATAHAGSLKELEKRPLYRELLSLNAFEAVVSISGRGERKYTVSEL